MDEEEEGKEDKEKTIVNNSMEIENNGEAREEKIKRSNKETLKKVNGPKKVIYNYHQDKNIKSEKTYYKDHMYGEENARNYKQLTPYQTWNLIGGDKPKKERLKYEKVSMSNNLRLYVSPVWKDFKSEGEDERLFGPKNNTVIYSFCH